MTCCRRELQTLVKVEQIKTGATVDASGNVNERIDSNWSQIGEEWVAIKTRGSREFFRGRQVGEDITHQITMEWSKKATKYNNTMRLRLDGRKLYISEPPVNVDEKNDWLVFACKEVPVL